MNLWKTSLITLLALLAAACARPQPISPTPMATGTPPPPPTAQIPSPSPLPSPSPIPRPTPTEASLFAPVTEADWQIGPLTATATIVVYNDFQCGYCAVMALTLQQLRAEYPADLRVVFRHYPLPQDDKAFLAAEAAEAAGAQGRFWAMHDWLYAHQNDWYALAPVTFRTQLSAAARELALDTDAFETALNTGAYTPTIAAAQRAAMSIPIIGAPFVLFNGRPYDDRGALNAWSLATLIRLEKLKPRQYRQAPPDIIDPFKSYVATLYTTHGEIEIQLFAEQAPLTVNNFVFLARAGWYDGVTFFRVLTDTLAQTGDPSETGYGGPGYFVPDEIAPATVFDAPGWVGMANAGPNTNGSQFFITLGAAPSLNGHYTRFGKVVRGLDVAQRLTPRDPNLTPLTVVGDVLEKVIITER